MTDQQARAAIEAARVSRIPSLEEVVTLQQEPERRRFVRVASSDADLAVKYAVLFKGGTVSEIRDEKLNILYSKGKANPRYVFWEDVGGPVAVRGLHKANHHCLVEGPEHGRVPGRVSRSNGWLGRQQEAGRD